MVSEVINNVKMKIEAPPTRKDGISEACHGPQAEDKKLELCVVSMDSEVYLLKRRRKSPRLCHPAFLTF